MSIYLVVVCSFVIIGALDQKLRKLSVDFREILGVVVVVVIEPVNTTNNHYMLPWSQPPSMYSFWCIRSSSIPQPMIAT